MEDNKVLISFVLPIYNVAPYLKECIDSLYEDSSLKCEKSCYEILLIDDGSTDDSGKICDDYADKCVNIVSFHKENGGASDARNYGLRRAKGKYVCFIDADDFLPKGVVSKLLSIANNSLAEIVLWDANVVDEQGRPIQGAADEFSHTLLQGDTHYSGQDFLRVNLELCNDYIRIIWLGMYERKFLLDNCLWFEKGLLLEDEMWIPITYLAAKSIYYIKEKFYCYRIRQGSAMNRVDKNYGETLASMAYIFSVLSSYYDYKITDNFLKRKMKANITKICLHAMAVLEVYRYPQVVKKIKKIEVLKNAEGIRNKIRALLLIICPRVFCLVNGKLRQYIH